MRAAGLRLFFSGRKHAGENLKELLLRRAANRPAPIQMCDALSRNLPAGLATILCPTVWLMAGDSLSMWQTGFLEECQHVLESLSVIYRNDAIAREQNLSPSRDCSFIRPRAVQLWRNFMTGLPGNSTSGGWNRTRRWAGPSPIC